MPHVLIVDNALDHELYRPVAHWQAALPPGVAWSSVPAVAAPLPPPDGPFTHVIVSGSEASICVRAPWAEAEAQWLAAVVAAGKAVLGSCWGHQLLAYALHGAASIRRAAVPEFGWPPLTVVDPADPLLGPHGPEVFAFNVHFDEVPSPPPGFVTTARSADCAVHGMRHTSRPLFGLQAHPEVPRADALGFLRAYEARLPQHGARLAQAKTEAGRDSGLAKAIVQAFLEVGV